MHEDCDARREDVKATQQTQRGAGFIRTSGDRFAQSGKFRKRDTAVQRAIKRRSRRVTNALSLRRFTEALKYACTQAGKIVVIERAIESGTSKTCGSCGWEDAALGHAKEFTCHMCDTTIGRDWNGARNNALQADGRQKE